MFAYLLHSDFQQTGASILVCVSDHHASLCLDAVCRALLLTYSVAVSSCCSTAKCP
jgi:hypothetical protein